MPLPKQVMPTCRVSSAPFSPETELTAFRERQDHAGAIVSFTGVVRPDNGVVALTLSHYPHYTEQEIQSICASASERFDLLDALIIHRIGSLTPGEVIVFVATAATHRRSAFLGADYLMDYLKSAAPFWKKEDRADGSHWIEPTARDMTDRHRWEDEP